MKTPTRDSVLTVGTNKERVEVPSVSVSDVVESWNLRLI